MTETEFINWLKKEKEIDIDRSGGYSTYGTLGKLYKTAEGVEIFYGLGVHGFPPHLDLSSIVPFLTNDMQFDYTTIQRAFYSDDITNEDRYRILIKQKPLIIHEDNN